MGWSNAGWASSRRATRSTFENCVSVYVSWASRPNMELDPPPDPNSFDRSTVAVPLAMEIPRRRTFSGISDVKGPPEASALVGPARSWFRAARATPTVLGTSRWTAPSLPSMKKYTVRLEIPPPALGEAPGNAVSAGEAAESGDDAVAGGDADGDSEADEAGDADSSPGDWGASVPALPMAPLQAATRRTANSGPLGPEIELSLMAMTPCGHPTPPEAGPRRSRSSRPAVTNVSQERAARSAFLQLAGALSSTCRPAAGRFPRR